jgi:hypothetical protein
MRGLKILIGWSVAAAFTVVTGAAGDLRLIEAVKARDLERVRALLKERVDVDASQGDGATALHWAAFHGHRATVELLLARGAHEGTPMQHAHELSFAGELGNGESRYALDLKPDFAGRLDYRTRVVPRHGLLTHPFELGLQCWV